MKVSDYEEKRKGTSYTIDTIRGLLKENSNLEIYWIVGADIMETFDKWKEPYEIVKLAKLVIFSRNGKEPCYTPENSIFLKKSKNLDLSSAQIKKLLKKDKSIEGLTPKPVIEYIKENNLYSTIK